MEFGIEKYANFISKSGKEKQRKELKNKIKKESEHFKRKKSFKYLGIFEADIF